MTVELDDLTTPLTVAEIETAFYDGMAARGVDTTSWKPGAVVRTLVKIIAIIFAGLSRLIALLAKSSFLDDSSGDWLTIKARKDYGVERIVGTFAAGSVTLTNAGAGVYSGGAGDLVVQNSTTGKAYTCTEAWSLSAFGSTTVAVQADEIGSASTSPATDIDTLVTQLLGVTVSNAAALIGVDEETDPALRERCRDKLGTLSIYGPPDAYAYYAKSAVRVADGTAIGVTRVKTVADGVGGVDVYVAKSDGAVPGTAGDPSTDLGAIQADIDAYVAPYGITATVQSATALAVALTYEIWLDESITLTDAEIDTAVTTAFTDWVRVQPIGGVEIPPASGKVYVSAIEGAIMGADDLEGYVVKLAITVPSGDTALTATQVPVAGVVTQTAVHRVTGGAF